jgi:hypothetical protein
MCGCWCEATTDAADVSVATPRLLTKDMVLSHLSGVTRATTAFLFDARVLLLQLRNEDRSKNIMVKVKKWDEREEKMRVSKNCFKVQNAEMVHHTKSLRLDIRP